MLSTGHAQQSTIEIEEGCDNLDKQVCRDCVLDIWADALESMIQESNEETSKIVLETIIFLLRYGHHSQG